MPYAIYKVLAWGESHSDFVTSEKDPLAVFKQFIEFVYRLNNHDSPASVGAMVEWVGNNIKHISLVELDILDDIDELLVDKLVNFINTSKDDDRLTVSRLRFESIGLANKRLSDAWLELTEPEKLKWMTEVRTITSHLIPGSIIGDTV